MRLTWFGGSTFRLYLGGRIIVTSPDRAPAGVEHAELVAAADHLIDLEDGISEFEVIDPERWHPRRPKRLVDQSGETIVELFAVGDEGLIVDEAEEGPVIIAPAGLKAWGRFADDAVVVVYGVPEAVTRGVNALAMVARPKLIALAAEGLTDDQFARTASAAGASPVQVLERGLALEA